MKKTIVTIVVLAAVVGGYMWVSKHARLEIGALAGQTDVVKRGDLVVPINASGNIKPASITQVKSKASGDVIELPFKVGAMVRKGDIVVQLRKVDEQINVDRAQSDLNRAKIALESAEISRRQKKEALIPSMRAKIEMAEARAERAMKTYENRKEMESRTRKDELSVVSQYELLEAGTAAKEAAAAVKDARAELTNLEIAIEMAELEIKSAKETVQSAEKTLADAKERLNETTVYSPIDGMILVQNIQMGEVIQSGKTMFTGGTVLMEIADVSEIYAVVNVDEADIGMVRQLAPPSARPGPTAAPPATLPEGTFDEGQPVEVTVETFKDEKFEGVIERISPQSEIVAAIATFKVWIRITSENRDKLIGLLNTQAEAHFTARSVRNALLVSYDAIQKDPNGEAYGVYIPVDVPGQQRQDAKFIPCEFGVDNGIDVEVRSGLKEGDVVYTKLPQKTQKEKEAEEKK